MKISMVLPLIGAVFIGAMAAPSVVEAALPCNVCADIYRQCLNDGHTHAYCDATWPAGCYGCPPPVDVSGQVAIKEESKQIKAESGVEQYQVANTAAIAALY